MFNQFRIFAPPEFPVLSLDVQARMPVAELRERSQFTLLVGHFLGRFFNNDMVSAEGEAKARLLQVVYAIALPAMVVALFLFPAYHAPIDRPFWSQVSDHYFYVQYSFVAAGVMSTFAWDLLFPDLLDLFVLSPLPILDRKLFEARIAAAGIFIGLFLLGSSALGAIFFPLLSEPPAFARHVFAHMAAVLLSGAFAALLFLSLQGTMAAILGEQVSRALSPFVQGISVMVLLTILLLFPVSSQFLQVLINLPAAQYFPPFWFLGIYERLLTGSSSLPVVNQLAKSGCVAMAAAMVLTVVSYPLAYWRKMRALVEGPDEFATQNVVVPPIQRLLHSTLLRNPMQRGIYHFISYSLWRTRRHRVYMAMYGGLGLALLTACTVLLKVAHGRLGFALSPDGLRAAIPITAFWTIAGLRAAFTSPADRRGSWIFRVLLGRPGAAQLDVTTQWIIPWVLALTLGLVAFLSFVAQAELPGWRPILSQALVAIGLCLLLTDVFFLKVRSVPFTGTERAPATNLAFILLQYFGLFPPLVWLSVDLESWLEASLWHMAPAIAIITVAHLAMRRVYIKEVEYHASLIDLDDHEEEFPQRLGLR